MLILFIAGIVSLVAFILGMFDVSIVLPAALKNRNRFSVALYYLPLPVLFIVLLGLMPMPPDSSESLTPTKAMAAPSYDEARNLVAGAIGPNQLGVDGSDLEVRANPKGEGLLVYVPETDYDGVERHLIWVVLKGNAYCVNGAGKNITPGLMWSRDADLDTWKTTGLNQLMPAPELISIIYN